MLKRVTSSLIATVMLMSVLPVISHADNRRSFGFEENEDEWIINSTDGRTSSGYDRYTKHSGERSYRFEAPTSTALESEYASIAKSFDVSYGSAYKVGIFYLLSKDYSRLNGSKGGAVFTYTMYDRNNIEIPDSGYEYYIEQPSYDEDDPDDIPWQGNDFYIIPTRDTAYVKISVGLRAATGQVNFDDISFEQIDLKDVLSNPVSKDQISGGAARDSYFCGWESGEESLNWWGMTLGKAAVASCGPTDEDAHTGSSCYMMRADEMNVTADNNQILINNKYNGSYFQVKPGVYQVSWWYKIDGPYLRASNSWGMSVNVSTYTIEGAENPTGKISKTYLSQEADQGWQKSEYNLTVPEGSNRIRINIGLRASTGTFKVDDLEITPLVNDMVSTPDLENYHGMTVRKLDQDGVFIDVRAQEALSDDVLDAVVFGNDESERAHNVEPGKSVTGYGGLGDTYRQLYPGDDKIWFTLKVDPEKMNYVTIKLWGSEFEKKEIKSLLINDEYDIMPIKYGTIWNVPDYMYDEPAQRNEYFYATCRLPVGMTHGKTEVKFYLSHYGAYSAYSANGYATANEFSRQIYKVVSHTDPRYMKMPDDKDGDTKRYDLGTIKVSPNGLSPYDYIVNEMNAGIEEILKSQNYGPQWEESVAAGRSPAGATGAVLEGTNSMNHGTWENWKNTHNAKCIGSNGESIKGFRAAAMAYNREWSNHYHDKEIVDRAVAWLDYYVRAQGSDGAWQNATYKTWIGGPDRMPGDLQMEAGERAIGEVLIELWEPISQGGYLDELMDDDMDPDTPMIPRRNAYATMYQKGTDFCVNVMQRRTSVNQDLFCVTSAASFQAALKKLDPSKMMDQDYFKYWMYSGTGIVLAPHDSIQISPKGLSLETHGHLNGAYDGNYGPHGASIVADLAYITGDDKVKQKAINAMNAMSYFEETIQNHENYIGIRREYAINTRNYKGPGHIEYAAWNNFSAAGLGSKDAVRSMELFIEYGEVYLSSLVKDRRLLYYMIRNMDCMGDAVKKASEGYKTFADIKDIPQEAAIVTLAWKGIIEGVNESNFAPEEKIDEATFKRWLKNAFGNDYELQYNELMSRAQAAYEIYYRLLNNGVYITKFDLGSGVYLPNEPWNKDENGRQTEYVFSDEIAESFALYHNGEILRMTTNWRSEYNGGGYNDRCREKATTSQVMKFHEMNEKWSGDGNGYMISPLGLRRVDIAKYGPYVIIMNCSDENKSCSIKFNGDVDKAHDLVSGKMISMHDEITMPALSTIILDLRETEG